MGERTENVENSDLGEILGQLAEVVHKRRGASPEQSYTARLLTEHEDTLCKKVVEEATELVLASKDHDHDHIRYEAADLLYHLLVLLERNDVTLEELAGELKARMS
ncbi:MAG: phosphoribosyl-ATP diphosphatase [Coriobacteriales bacterium]|jgi:phosphoribosyl-ATP pyrophosphohydrolase|nr:phosphoribosyl-ATP diphosphatase [Coriobacteriales bacterium]